MKIYRRIQVYGKVQGVAYRYSTKLRAIELGLKGTVQNRKDGSVLINVYGEENMVNQLISWCEDGPPYAAVEKLDVQNNDVFECDDFEIIR